MTTPTLTTPASTGTTSASAVVDAEELDAVRVCVDALALDCDPSDRVGVAVAVLDRVCNLDPLSRDAVEVGWGLAVAIGCLLTIPGTVDVFEEAARVVRRTVQSPRSLYSAIVGLGITDPGTGRRRAALADRVTGGVNRLLMDLEARGLVLRTPAERDLGV